MTSPSTTRAPCSRMTFARVGFDPTRASLSAGPKTTRALVRRVLIDFRGSTSLLPWIPTGITGTSPMIPNRNGPSLNGSRAPPGPRVPSG